MEIRIRCRFCHPLVGSESRYSLRVKEMSRVIPSDPDIGISPQLWRGILTIVRASFALQTAPFRCTKRGEPGPDRAGRRSDITTEVRHEPGEEPNGASFLNAAAVGVLPVRQLRNGGPGAQPVARVSKMFVSNPESLVVSGRTFDDSEMASPVAIAEVRRTVETISDIHCATNASEASSAE